MLRRHCLSLILILTIILRTPPVLSLDLDEFNLRLSDWNNKISIASEFLEEAEKSLKSGDKNQGCLMQKKAGKMGVEATKSLIIAFKINGATESELDNINSGMNKWRELRDFCKNNYNK